MGPKIIYLDQNKWIELSQAYYNRCDGQEYNIVLDIIEKNLAENSIIIPLSYSHIIETNLEKDEQRRKRLAHVMVVLSKGYSMESELVVEHLEAYKAVCAHFKYSPNIIHHEQFIRFGFLQDVGIIINRDEELKIIFKMLNSRSSHPDQMKKMIKLAKETTIKMQEIKNTNIQHVKNREELYWINLDSAIDRLMPTIENTCTAIGKTLDEFIASFSTLEERRSFMDNLPTNNASSWLLSEDTMQKQRPLQKNDLEDISFLSVAIPYCDVVVSEKYWIDIAKRIKLDDKYNTKLLINLSDIARLLD